MNVHRRDEIIDQLGADDWEMVAGAYDEMSVDDIEVELDEMFDDDNSQLANDIYEELQ